jgi:small-conductance mechanosensitive channel
MSNQLMTAPQKEMDGLKRAQTLDEVVKRQLDAVTDLINEHIKNVYEDFNRAMANQLQNVDRVENSVSHMVQVLWGIVNKSNARTAALERVLLKNGLSQDDLEAEILKVEQELQATGQWDSLDMKQVAGKMGIEIPTQGNGALTPS